MTVVRRLVQLMEDLEKVQLLEKEDKVLISWGESQSIIYHDGIQNVQCLFSIEIVFSNFSRAYDEETGETYIVKAFEEEFPELKIQNSFAQEFYPNNSKADSLLIIAY